MKSAQPSLAHPEWATPASGMMNLFPRLACSAFVCHREVDALVPDDDRPRSDVRAVVVTHVAPDGDQELPHGDGEDWKLQLGVKEEALEVLE